MKETKIEIHSGFEVEKIETQDGHVVVTFKEKERKLPKSWEEFCKNFPIKEGECYINEISVVIERDDNINRLPDCDKLCLPDCATAEAVLALCQLIQLRNCYNGDWVPDWNYKQDKYTIEFHGNEISCNMVVRNTAILSFKTKELCDEFLRNFRPLIEKLKPLYGIKEGGEE